MAKIKHFSHENHSLKLIENLVTIVGIDDDNDDKKEVVSCYGCQEPISGGSTYGCIQCSHFLHEACTKLMPTFNLYLHPLHSLTLKDNKDVKSWQCDVCCSIYIACGFSYCCSLCNFDVCVKCVVAIVAHEAATAALKKEASIKFEHKGHPQHTLTLQLRPAAFRCDACKNESKDLFYQCDNCDFWIHKTCASLEPTIDIPHHPNHPLVLVYSLPDTFYNFYYFCEFCDKAILRDDWLYHCANCRYFVHIKCASNPPQPSTPRDGAGTSIAEEDINDFMHFPMSDAFTDPLKLLHFEKIDPDNDTPTEIGHSSHKHPLILNVEPQGNNMSDIRCNDPIEVCYGCVRPISHPYYSCKDRCSFILHKYCVELPSTLEHQLHVDHLLHLVQRIDGYVYKCNGCFGYCNTFLYGCEACNFYLDVNCTFLPNTIKHESHKHPLIQIIDPNPYCKACNKWFGGISYSCKACNFQLDLYCAMKSPNSLAHRYCKGHQIPLTYPPIEDHPEDFYCDICEIDMHPKFPLYHCHKCRNSFHLDCLSQINYYENMWQEGTITVSYHKHPLTYVRKKKTPKYVCSNCNCDINGYLILECRANVCNFNICYQCHRRK